MFIYNLLVFKNFKGLSDFLVLDLFHPKTLNLIFLNQKKLFLIKFHCLYIG